MKSKLEINTLFNEAIEFCKIASQTNFPELIGVSDGKAVGTIIEHKFKSYLLERYEFKNGNSANGIDLPDDHINTDIKVTSIKQPQSSCPYKSSNQKIFGLGYNLLIMVYEKKDTHDTCFLNFLSCNFVNEEKTADFTMTKRLIEMINDGAEKEDIVGFLYDRNIPGDEILLNLLADKILKDGVAQGYLTISNALQWRLQYKRVISLNNTVEGINNCVFK